MSMYGKPNVKGELKCMDESKTKQSFEDESNINTIFNRAIKNGWDPRTMPAVESSFADVSQVGDFRDAQDRILRGNEIFGQLSAEDRKKFGNDPAVFFEFASDPENADAVTEMRFGKEALNAVRAGRAVQSGGEVSHGDAPGEVRESGAGGDRAPGQPGAGPVGPAGGGARAPR